MKKYYIGYKFDNGNVIIDGPSRILQPSGSHATVWLMRCPCGNERWTYTNFIMKSSYPCKKCYDESLKRKDNGPAILRAFISLSSNAKTRGYSVNISLEEFYQIASQDCWWCGGHPIEKSGPKKWQNSVKLNGIDRLDNLRGYDFDNCVPSCYFCNRIKSDLTETEFLSKIEKIYKRRKNA
jgi:hypothetical protein